jgi:molybdopterin-guanine dinucleotide biosynthesis protein B
MKKIPAVISIIGKSKSGKTSLIEKLIPEFKRRGYKVGVLKHAGHGFQMDKEGKDSQRHKKAGANAVMVASSDKFALIQDVGEKSVDDLIGYFNDVNLLIIEGYKQEKKPKIEVFRKNSGHKEPFCMEDPNLIAFVTDCGFCSDIPVFSLNDIPGVADFIEKNILSMT